MKKKKKVIRYITDVLEFSSDDSDEFDEKQIKIKYHDGVFMRAKSLRGKQKNIGHLLFKRERKGMVYF